MTTSEPRHAGTPVGGEREHLLGGFGALLRHERTRAGLTQSQLGEQTGLTERSIRYLETGMRRPRIDAVSALAYVLRRPQAWPDGMTGPGMDIRPAEELAELLRGAAGESLRGNVTRPVRADVVGHLAKFGLTRRERHDESLARLRAALATAHPDLIDAIERDAKRAKVPESTLELIATEKAKAIREGRTTGMHGGSSREYG